MAWISDLLARGPTYSFEFFPPKDDAEQATLVRTLRELEPLAPSFVSVTYRGGRESRKRTHDLVAGMLRTTTPLAHGALGLRGPYPPGTGRDPGSFRKAGVENLMALGGDPPAEPRDGPSGAVARDRAGGVGPGDRGFLDRRRRRIPPGTRRRPT